MKYLLFFLCFTTSLLGEIREMTNMSSLYNEHFDSQTLLIVDLDNTLIEPAQSLGTDQWFAHRFDHYKTQGLNTKEALKKTIPEWDAIHNLTNVVLVEKDTAQIVKHLQNNHVKILGLTSRGFTLANATRRQLNSVGIDLSYCTIGNEDQYFSHLIFYRKGILYTSGTNKTEALSEFFASINYYPQKIIFVDDKKSHLIPMDVQCQKWDIIFIGLRYGYLDEKVKNFRPEIADVQLEKCSFILSDEEASQLLR